MKKEVKFKTITYARLKNTGNYENERIEATVEVKEGQSATEALKVAKRFVNEQLDIDEECVKPSKRFFADSHGPVCVCDECM